MVSSLVIAATVLMFIASQIDPNKTSDNSFLNLMVPSLNEIRKGRYLGLLTSSLLETSFLFLAWEIGWMWHFGQTIENRINAFFYISLIISSIIFPELFQILIFEQTGYGPGGIIYALFGFTWFRSVYEPLNWPVSYREKASCIAFIFLCILVDYTGIYKVGIGGLVGGFIWGVFFGFVSRTIRIRLLQIFIPVFVLAVFLVPIFWAPWQISWLLNQADKYEAQKKPEEAKEVYSKILEKDPENKDGKAGLIYVLSVEAYDFDIKEDYEKAKELYAQILNLDPNNSFAKDNLKIIRISELEDDVEKAYEQKDYQKTKAICDQILDLDPDNELAKDRLKIIPNKTK